MNSTGSKNGSPPDDGDWSVLTEGMEPYERFRYIVRKLLEVTIEDAQTYTLDERPSKAGTSRTKPRTK